MNKKLPVSVIIIAKNEAAVIRRALLSVTAFASEIIAVINDCSDNTKAILEEFGAKIYEHDWQGFVIQKNRALSYATKPWIFSIDADEEVSPQMARDIATVINEGQYQAASFCRKTCLVNRWIKHGDWYPDRIIRLFLKDKAKFTGDYIHEKIVVDGKIKKCKSNLLHYSYPSMYLFLTKTEGFTKAFVKINHKKFSVFTAIFRAFWRFFRAYIIKLGFLDGYFGFIIAINNAYAVFFKYNLLLEEEIKNEPIIFDKEDL